MKSRLTIVLVFMVAFSSVGAFQWLAQDRPYKKMKAQIATLSLGIPLQQAKALIERTPEVSCSSASECRQKLKHHYSDYAPSPLLKVDGPTLVYRMAGIKRIHCLYFDEQQKLQSVSESKLLP